MIEDSVKEFIAETMRLQGRYEAYLANIENLRESVVALEDEQQDLQTISGTLSNLSEKLQDSVQELVEAIVSRGLQTIFQEEMSIRLTNKMVGRRPETDITLISGDLETSILNARGGGVAAVTGFLLRVVMLLLAPNTRRVMFLDEAFAQVSVEYEERLAQFISELCENAKLQIILVTHSTTYFDSADRAFSVSQKGGKTSVTQISI